MSKSHNPVRVEMPDLDDEKDSLANFLQKHFKLKSVIISDGLQLDGAEVSTMELQRMVTKFVNSKKLNSSHWAAVDGNAVKIRRFNHKKEEKKNKHPQTASTIKHGW
ncbi:MAG: hypothetical protein ACLQO7_07775 [Candidatus Bathyarchaeia archaeon]